MPAKISASEYDICLKSSAAIFNHIFINVITLVKRQTVWSQIRLLLGAVWSGSHCLTKRLLKHFSSRQKQMTFVIGPLRVSNHLLQMFLMKCFRLLTFFQNIFLQKFFQEHYRSVKQFRSRSGPTFCQSWSGSKLFVKVISRQQKLPLAPKGLIVYRESTHKK